MQIIITKIYVIAARKYCRSCTPGCQNKLWSFIKKNKKMPVIPTYLLFLTQIPSLTINYLTYLYIIVYMFSASGESLGP